MKRYAEKCDADFFVIEKNKKDLPPHFLKIDAISFLENYDKVLILDTDILIREKTPNIFENFNSCNVYGVDEKFHSPGYIGEYSTCCEFLGIKPLKFFTAYNTGLMLLDKNSLKLNYEKVYISKIPTLNEQVFWNVIISASPLKKGFLPISYNTMPWHFFKNDEDGRLKKIWDNRFDSYIIHYAGFLPRFGIDETISFIKNDMQIMGES